LSLLNCGDHPVYPSVEGCHLADGQGVDRAEKTADETQAEEQDEEQTDKPEDEVEREVTPPPAHGDGNWWYEEGEDVSHRRPLSKKVIA